MLTTTVRAEVQGPGEDLLWAQVDDLLASVHYEPALQPTDRMDEAAGVARPGRQRAQRTLLNGELVLRQSA